MKIACELDLINLNKNLCKGKAYWTKKIISPIKFIINNTTIYIKHERRLIEIQIKYRYNCIVPLHIK